MLGLTHSMDRVSSLLRSATFRFKAVDDAGSKVETQLKRYHDKQVEHH